MRPLGYLDEVTRYSISGWAGDLDNTKITVTVLIYVNGEFLHRAHAATVRLGLDEVGLEATGAYGFKHHFETPLSPFDRNTVEVRIEGSDYQLDPGVVTLDAVKSRGFTTSRPQNGVLLSTMGRSGSTLLMGLLESHPAIVVGDKRPYEIELLTYYSYLFRMLVAAGDHERSLRPDKITDISFRYKIGFNPFFESSFRENFGNKNQFDDFLNGKLPQTFGNSFEKIILDFYEAVALDKNIKSPIYFAEKAIPEFEIREGSRYFFPKLKEIVLVRDLRDVACSFMNYGNMSLEQSIEYIVSSSRNILSIKLLKNTDILFVKYEDLIQNFDKVYSEIFKYLGLSVDESHSELTFSALFAGHGTSESPQNSIGRWKNDLSAADIQQCSEFEAFRQAFGYAD